jgi:hypothetical protein
VRYLCRRLVPQLLWNSNVHFDPLVHEAAQRLKGLAGAAGEPRVVLTLLVHVVREEAVANRLQSLDQSQLGNGVSKERETSY